MGFERISGNFDQRAVPPLQTGRELEYALLRKGRISLEERTRHMQLDEAMAFVRNHQPPLFERSTTIRALRAKIAERCTDKNTPVKFYTAIDTPLDLYYGVDAFFEQGSTVVTIDVSEREKDTPKADVVLAASVDPEGSIVVEEAEVERVAHRVADLLNTRQRAQAM